jgi:hypothetical protein
MDQGTFPNAGAGEQPLASLSLSQGRFELSLERVEATGDGAVRSAEHDPARFAVVGSEFITQDEESSGVIPAPFLGTGKYLYLIDVQNHRASPDPELVEGGQLLVLSIPPGKPVD